MDDELQTFRDLLEIYYFIYRLEEDSLLVDENLKKRILNTLRKLEEKNVNAWYQLLNRTPLHLLLSEESPEKNSQKTLTVKMFRNLLEKGIMRSSKLIRSLKNESEAILVPPAFYYDPIELLGGFKYIEGKNDFVLVASHTKPPLEDANTEKIALNVGLKTSSHILISEISRVYVDYNRAYARITPFRHLLEKLVISGKVRYVMDLHGYNLEEDVDIRIGTGMVTSKDDFFVRALTESFYQHGLSAIIDWKRYHGGDIVHYHNVPPNVRAIQIEINSSARHLKRRKIEQALTKFIGGVMREKKVRRH